jgi:hypothetical protein
MLKKVKINLSLFLICLIPFIGCYPSKQQVIVEPKKEIVTTTTLLFPTALIDQKIAELDGISKRKELSAEERDMAMELLTLYGKLRESTIKGSLPSEQSMVIYSLFEALTRLDHKYFSRTMPAAPDDSKVMKRFSLKRKKILDAYIAQNHEDVMKRCTELEAEFGPDSLIPEIGLVLALSMAKKGMIREAIDVGERVSREFEGKPGLLDLRASIIEWQMSVGERGVALENYEKMIDYLGEREALVSGLKQKVSTDQDKLIHPGKDRQAETISDEKAIPEEGSIEELLKKVDRLVQQHHFSQAKFLLLQRRIRVQEGSEMETLDQAVKSVELAEEKYLNEQNISKSQDSETLETAKKLIEEEKFEEALTKLKTIEQPERLHDEKKTLEGLAVEKLINQERDKAARIFLMAKKTEDPKKKEELLLSSYKILKALIDKYPSSNLINKLNNNISRVKEELLKLGVSPG